MKLVFVCSGNTCRSPLAVAAWQVAVREMAPWQRAFLESVEVGSAGLHARAGARASEGARRVAGQWQVDLGAHRARAWSSRNNERADLLVAMTGAQVGQIRFALGNETLEWAPRVRTLGEFVPRGADLAWAWPLWDATRQGRSERDIFDPYGGSLEAYEECGARILRGVRALANSLCEQK